MAGNCISKSRILVQYEENESPSESSSQRQQRAESQRVLLKVWREFSEKSGCVIINDTSSQTRLLEEILKQKRTVTSYEGYLVNEEDNLDPGVITDDSGSCSTRSKSVDGFPIEIVDLPDEPDGKKIDIHFVKEGQVTDASVKPEDIDCGVSLRSMGSERHQWSFSLYNFEDNSRISKQDLTNLVKSIYDALGKSVEKANRKSCHDGVKKVKVHISLSNSKERSTREMRGATIVPRRQVLIGAEDLTIERLTIKDNTSSEEGLSSTKKQRRKQRDDFSTVQVLNNDLGNGRSLTAKCKCCTAEIKTKSSNKSSKNSNLLADRPHIPARRKTEPGGSFTPELQPAQDLAQLAEKKLKSSRSQRRARRRSPSPGGHMPGYASPGGRVCPLLDHYDHQTHVCRLSGYHSPVPSRHDVPLDPTYAYHAEENRYLYMHAFPKQPPFEELKPARRHKGKHRRARDGGEKPPGTSTHAGKTSIVHRHEHVHHHYHHYGEKR